jgi:hypothetical protein
VHPVATIMMHDMIARLSTAPVREA